MTKSTPNFGMWKLINCLTEKSFNVLLWLTTTLLFLAESKSNTNQRSVLLNLIKTSFWKSELVWSPTQSTCYISKVFPWILRMFSVKISYLFSVSHHGKMCPDHLFPCSGQGRSEPAAHLLTRPAVGQKIKRYIVLNTNMKLSLHVVNFTVFCVRGITFDSCFDLVPLVE